MLWEESTPEFVLESIGYWKYYFGIKTCWMLSVRLIIVLYFFQKRCWPDSEGTIPLRTVSDIWSFCQIFSGRRNMIIIFGFPIYSHTQTRVRTHTCNAHILKRIHTQTHMHTHTHARTPSRLTSSLYISQRCLNF